MLVAVLGDTHIPYRARTLPVAAWQAIGDADLILHTGDVCESSVLDELSDTAPVRCVVGNVDPMEIVEWGASETMQVTIDGVTVAMVHDSGATQGRAARMRRRFPESDVVVFGHSHMPLVERQADLELLLLNPGSPTDRRRAPVHTLALLELRDGRAEARIVELG